MVSLHSNRTLTKTVGQIDLELLILLPPPLTFITTPNVIHGGHSLCSICTQEEPGSRLIR
ncbi:hypothetical protein T10_10965 [Trichinella papuae]|uniref:Uncharacterized protein n=1 Tax=Trichinella papuae TaxID=268474 RepID=A0A0V1LZ99_9BILA|nr:hypothetical protein T10_10965 [Trichinella papuae]